MSKPKDTINLEVSDSDVALDDFDTVIETDAFGPQTAEIQDFLMKRVIGQTQAHQSVCRSLSIHNSGLGDPLRPIGVFLFTGPTGVGKTETAKELAKYLIYGKELGGKVNTYPLTNIPCATYSKEHEVSKLFGSPPGYVRSDELGVLSQARIDQHHFWHAVTPYLERYKDKKVQNDDMVNAMVNILPGLYRHCGPYTSVILFDEIEKADKSVENVLLHIIEDGELSMSDGSVTDFSNSIIILTSNVGGAEMQAVASGRGGKMGFGSSTESLINIANEEISERALRALRERFSPEFIGRLQENIVVFRMLQREDCKFILENMLQKVQRRIMDERANCERIKLRFSNRFKEYLLSKGEVDKFGARPIRGLVDENVPKLLSNALESGQLRSMDVVLFDYDPVLNKVVMRRKNRPEPVRALAKTRIISID